MDGDTLPHRSRGTVSGDPYEIVGVDRSASKAEIQRAFRRRARECHPDVSGDPESVALFRELVAAFKMLERRPDGSSESHVLWPYLSSLDKYWSKEQGHTTADELEQYLADLGKLDEYWDELSEAEGVLAAASGNNDDDDARPQQDAAAVSSSTSDSSHLVALLGYRVFLGSEQWRAQWASASDAGGAEEDGDQTSWERWATLERLGSDALLREAERLRAESAAAA